jgi:hypothetical protein
MADTTTSEQSTGPLPKRRDFRFLKPLDSLLAEYTEKAVKLSNEYPEECLVNIRKFAEYVVVYVEGAAQLSNATDSDKGANEDEERTDFIPRVVRLENHIPFKRREDLKYLWKRGNDGAHSPKVLLTENQVRARQDQIKKTVLPTLQAALEVAKWVQRDCANKQSTWTWIVSVFRRRPIGLKEKLEGSITNRNPPPKKS